jgi:V-type H+-transporting ATPase subunit D
MGKILQVASFSFAEVSYIAGDIRLHFLIHTFNATTNWHLMFSYQVRESVGKAQLKVKTVQENVSGVMLPTFESYHEGGNGTALQSLVYLLLT